MTKYTYSFGKPDDTPEARQQAVTKMREAFGHVFVAVSRHFSFADMENSSLQQGYDILTKGDHKHIAKIHTYMDPPSITFDSGAPLKEEKSQSEVPSATKRKIHMLKDEQGKRIHKEALEKLIPGLLEKHGGTKVTSEIIAMS